MHVVTRRANAHLGVSYCTGFALNDQRLSFGVSMKFSVSPFDEMFGERVELEIPGPNGIAKRSVTKKWLEKMETEGKIAKSQTPVIQVHMLHPMRGYYVATWEIGNHVSAEVVEKLKDAASDALYAVTILRAGEPETHVIPKSAWDSLKAQNYG